MLAPMIKLYGSARSRASRSLLALEELGLPYEHIPLRAWENPADAEALALWPVSPAERGRLYQWSVWAQTEIDVLARHRARSSDEKARKEAAQAERLAALARLDAALVGAPWLLGEAFTLADLSVASTLSEPWENGRIDGDLDPADHGLAALAGWLARCTGPASWDRVRSLA